MGLALQAGTLQRTVSVRRGDIACEVGCWAGPPGRWAHFSHVRARVTYGASRRLSRHALVHCGAHKEEMERQAGSGPSGPLGLSYRRIGDTLSSVTAAVVLSAAVTLLPVVSQPGVAVADTAGSLPGLTSDQELQFQQFQKYQQQQSAYEQMQAKVRAVRAFVDTC